ncbi:3-hydroxyacyl-ACP dehydratase [uncultured Desulfovibrio sp.]|uniref:3-hydroxyacyl-ACP dehydratase n=1 Tax=uncultured Desulfovibrio sp. TaxID=167968 RepID=UPI00261DE538|nr:3-hydroxyacyl-ACP dehydratase [uncultured Desulfovibrio sp.]
MKSLERLLPHRAPMLLLDELLEWSPEGARAAVRVREGNPFLRPDGTLERAAFAEMLAQCFAAGAGACLRHTGGTAPGVGYLAALRDVELLADARVGQKLTVATRVTARLGGVIAAEGDVCAGDLVLARGAFKVFIPEGGA